MRNYNANNLGFKPKQKPRAQSLRKRKDVVIGEPETRLPPKPEKQLRYEDPVMAEREAKAQVEIDYKKTCTAPAFSKGAYQYVYSEEQAKLVGKKNG